LVHISIFIESNARKQAGEGSRGISGQWTAVSSQRSVVWKVLEVLEVLEVKDGVRSMPHQW